MKNTRISLVALLISLAASQTMFAQLDNMPFMSAEYIRSAARNAATDAADGVAYNPAGLTKLKEDGLYVNISNQSLFRTPSHKYNLGFGEKEFKQAGADYFLPNLYIAYRDEDLSIWGGCYISGGGATLNFPKGSVNTELIGLGALAGAQGAYTEAKEQYIKASSFYLTPTVGATYQVLDEVSVAIGARYIMATNKSELGMTLSSSPIGLPDQPLALDITQTAYGWRWMAGLNVSPLEFLTISLRYETEAKLDFETKEDKDDFGIIDDTKKSRRDLPAIFALGGAVSPFENFKIYVDYNYYKQKQADWGKTIVDGKETEWSEIAGDAAIYSLGLEYALSEDFLVSLGGGYTDYMYKDLPTYFSQPGPIEVVQTDNINLNIGCRITIFETIKLNLGFMHIMFEKDQKVDLKNAPPKQVTLNSGYEEVAIGLDILF